MEPVRIVDDYAHSIELSGFTKYEFLDQLSDYPLFKQALCSMEFADMKRK
jgi:hypothetical protein